VPLADDIKAKATTIDLPYGERGNVIDLTDVAGIATANNMPGHTVEAQALRMGIHPKRYLRNQQSISMAQQADLLESTIAQIGLGGLGGTLLELFLRTGIGSIRCADGDAFEETNLNRQALSTIDTLGVSKTEAAIRRKDEINPSISLKTCNQFLTAKTLPTFLEGADIAIDALGGLETRPALQSAAAKADIPLITGALAGWTGYVSVVMPGFPGPADIMGTDNGAEEQLGCPAPAVTFFASLMASELINILTEKNPPTSPSILLVDLQNLTFDRVQL
jgi:molybdopterin/thiamine biosynthesis adenylyltransferase